MGVTPIGHPTLTPAGVRAIASRSALLVDQGLIGACLPVETEDGTVFARDTLVRARVSPQTEPV